MYRKLSSLVSTSILAAGLSSAQAQEALAPQDRLGQLREYSYLAPNATLAELQKLKLQAGKWPQRDQAAYYSLLSNVIRSTDRAAALQAAEEEEHIGRQLGDDAIVANSLLDRSFIHATRGEDEAATRAVEQARELAFQTSDLVVQAKTVITAGRDDIRQGNARRGLEQINRAVKLADASGQAIIQFMALRARAYALNDLAGGSEEALRAIEELKAKAAAIPFDGPMARARLAEYQIAYDAGQLARSREALTEVLSWLQKHHMDEAVPDMQVSLADLSLRSQDYKEALRLSRESKKAAQAADDPLSVELSQFNEGIALIYLGQLEAGRHAIEATNEEFIDADALFEYARALDYVGEKEFALKVYARASRKAQEAKAAKDLLQKKNRENEERLREQDENVKASRNEEKLRFAWSAAAALAAVALLAVAFLYRKLRLANARLKNSDMSAG
jgi:hypothetical protein